MSIASPGTRKLCQRLRYTQPVPDAALRSRNFAELGALEDRVDPAATLGRKLVVQSAHADRLSTCS